MAASIQKQAKKRRRRIAAPLGGLFVALAVIGVITVVVTSIRMTFSFLDNDSEKRRFEDIIRPVVMFNPGPFENPVDIEMPSLLRCAMWAALTSDKRSTYEYSDSIELIVPATDLDVAAARMFGPEVTLTHTTFGDYDITYSYIEEEGVYKFPTNALYVYSPRVMEITKDGEFYNLLVAYIPPADAWTSYSGGDSTEIQPDKYMIYVMRKSGDTYHIAKVQDPPTELVLTDGTVVANQGS